MTIILEDLDFGWTTEDIYKVATMWVEGLGLDEISNKIQRDGDEVFLLLLHLAREGKIESRSSFIWQERLEIGC